MNGRAWIIGWVITLLMSQSAQGIITSDTKGSHCVTAGQSSFGTNIDGVGLISFLPDGGADTIDNLQFPVGTAALIADRYLLTAAHLFDPDRNGEVDPFDFGVPLGVGFEVGQTSVVLPLNSGHGEVPRVYLPPGWPADFTDLAVVELLADAPAEIPRYPVYSGEHELGKPIVLVGYGAAGDGPTGKDSDWDPRPTKRVACNRIEGVTYLPGWSTLLLYDFDSGQAAHNALAFLDTPSDLGFGADEGMSSPGDSGSPLLLNGVVAGVTSAGQRIPSADVNDRADFSWGEISCSTRVSSWREFIAAATNQTATFVQWPYPFGDLDFNNSVDSGDLLEFLANWTGELEPNVGSAYYETGDSDSDGDVDSADLMAFIGAWTGAPVSPAPSYVSEPVGTELLAVLGVLAHRRARRPIRGRSGNAYREPQTIEHQLGG